jgi:hypothetical protein
MKNKSQAELFCKRINKLSRYGSYKLIPKRNSLIEEFHAKDCSFNFSKFRIGNEWIELREGVYEVRR